MEPAAAGSNCVHYKILRTLINIRVPDTEFPDYVKKLQTVKTPHEKETLQRQIDALDHQIDRLVYELYDLMEKEIGIVEECK